MNNTELGYISPEQILKADSSEEFLNLMQIYSEDSFDRSFVERMQKAVVMSHYKYGFISEKPNSHYSMLAGFDDVAYKKDKNVEHMINIANYAMFRYIQKDKYGENPQDLLTIAIDAMHEYTQNIDNYVGTDSDQSVQHKKVKPAPVRKFLREAFMEDIIRKGHPGYFTEDEKLLFTIYD